MSAQTLHRFERYEITEEIRQKQKTWSTFEGNRKTFRDSDDGLIAGHYGEIVFQSTYPNAEFIGDKDFEADFIHNGARVDVKTKVRARHFCQSYYEASVAEYQLTNDCDYYFFYSFNVAENTLEFCGYMSKAEYLRVATKKKKGDYDYSNGHTCQNDCRNLPYSQLLIPGQVTMKQIKEQSDYCPECFKLTRPIRLHSGRFHSYRCHYDACRFEWIAETERTE